ncbi:aminopeptidase [Catenaria anguillulae PL171]|uniref:Aminopeptidase n=1 Tax=Catenaria anguillulae PL171 TaxID=765915 RepID=A0A1Y2HL96_9FUNG|nr:aminopeptidase [Catenaria anguillulae PL171]
MSEEREILPTNVVPTHYNVELTPDLESFTFEGSVDIQVKIVEATSVVKVNVKELELHAARISLSHNKAEKTLLAASITDDSHTEQATITFPEELPAGAQATLSITFKGIHNDKMAGFYRSGYKDNEGKQKHMVVTQFEATDARRAFPCWDEPALKATFDVTLNVRKELTALSNMNVVSEEAHASKATHKSVKFARTPIMSTYLLAFAVGELEYIESKTSPSCKALPNPVTVRVYTTKGESGKGKFGLGCAVRILEYFSEVFGEPYPLPKMDMIAVPDFSAGAMENWGLVTYRTIYLLFDEKTSSAKTKEGVAYVVAHELAHQWFGNLVTMEWWNELWLNEGFATWVGWLATDALFPDWNIWTSFVSNDMNRAFGLDGMRSSHPIQVPVSSAREISQIFDAISYSKGASVIRMLSSWLSQEVFLAGIRKYIQRHKYGNASTNDLWTALSEASGLNVNDFMNLWTSKIGYPVLSAERKGDKVHVSQARFLSTGDVKAEEDETLWWCPLNMYTGDDEATKRTAQSTILKTREGVFQLPARPAGSAIDMYKLNRHQANFYRVKYAPADLEKLGEAISSGSGVLNTSDRVGLVGDVFALAAAGYTSTVDALTLLKHFNKEDEYIALNIVAEKLAHLKTVWTTEPEEVTERLNALARSIFAPTARKVGWEFHDGEGQLDVLLRTLAISVAGMNSDKDVVAQAKTRFARFIQGDDAAIHPNLRGAVYNIVLKHAAAGSRAEFDQIKAIWENETLATDQRLAALAALGRHPDLALSSELLEYTLNSGKVRDQDFMYPLRSVAANHKARVLAWQFVQNNWATLESKFKSSLSLLSHCVSIAADWADAEFGNEVKVFFEDKDTKAVDRALGQTLEKISAQSAWLNRDRDAVAQWLKENVQA